MLLPWLSELKRQNHAPRVAYVKVVELTTGVTWPIFATVAILNHELILVLFGDQWTKSAELVPYICAATAIGAAYGVCSPLYNSLGKPSADLLAQAVNLPIKVLAIVVLANHGLEAVAKSWPAIALAGAVMHSLLMKKFADIRIFDTILAVKRSFLLSVAALLSAVGMSHLVGDEASAATALFLGSAAAGSATLLAAAATKHPLASEIQRVLLNRRKSPTT